MHISGVTNVCQARVGAAEEPDLCIRLTQFVKVPANRRSQLRKRKLRDLKPEGLNSTTLESSGSMSKKIPRSGPYPSSVELELLMWGWGLIFSFMFLLGALTHGQGSGILLQGHPGLARDRSVSHEVR